MNAQAHMTNALEDPAVTAYRHFVRGYRRAQPTSDGFERRIGAELKFPLVNPDGTAAPVEALRSLWHHLIGRGWTPEYDSLTNRLSGVRKPGELNDTVASFETGYCKPEFSLAHVGNLHALAASVKSLTAELSRFSRDNGVFFLGYGIQPVTPPSKHLVMRKARTSFWDKAMPSNRRIPPEQGDDVHLFTVNAASHVHVNVTLEETVPAVNVLNGFAGAQIALMANSSVWGGRADAEYRCVAEKLWDWWEPAVGRCGVPARQFVDAADYVRAVAELRPVYVKRNGKPIVIGHYPRFVDYLASRPAKGYDLDGREVPLNPVPEDLDLHNSCYWYCARASRYYTVENRACDQQPPGELLCPAALTLGLISALGEAREELRSWAWADLRNGRTSACSAGLNGWAGSLPLSTLAGRMVAIARTGLQRRGLGEERFLAPLDERLARKACPADGVRDLVERSGVPALVAAAAV